MAKREKTFGELYDEQIMFCNLQMGLWAAMFLISVGVPIVGFFGPTIADEWHKHITPLFKK